MKRSIAFLAASMITITSCAQSKPDAGHIMTSWAEKVDPQQPLPDYPRPQLVRSTWLNLNGQWQYAVLPAAEQNIPTAYAGKILVPFAIESALSGVTKTVGKESALWYQRSVAVPAAFKNKRVLLHFGAVDWLCDVYINGKKVGTHQGGYDPFSIDITSALNKSGNQQLAVRVWDPSDEGPQPRGKQVKNPNGIWYTPVTGIWQTVWLEGVPQSYISSIKQTPDIDKSVIRVSAQVENAQPGDQVLIAAYHGTEKITEQTTTPGAEVALSISNPELWSPSHPFLYDLKVSLLQKNKKTDDISSYFAMRKISVGTDNNGIQRMLLNNEFVFQYGPLDQGWWPDGLYTAPTDEALKYDIEQTKAMGFNMIRKHVKVEPARWYNYCDKLGMLVWQDMPSGDLGNRWESRPGIYGKATDKNRSAESESSYRNEWRAIMDKLYNFPSIVVWVPFNEGWGQFKTKDIVQATRQQDPSRLVNSASGGNFEPVGHIIDLHNYPEPLMPDPSLFGSKQVLVLGEFGGLGLPIEGHTWQQKNNWGYVSFKNNDELLQRYEEFVNRIPNLIKAGLSAAVYTQTTDVEVETNGLMTYDRKVIKMPVATLNKVHSKLYETASVAMKK
ncbi:beta-galactosidase [Niastella yeongjuensis]|uniref:Beta-galactosidase n=1 Tax=Niastella yeongjuensis TaxID=354355 RepID=A0A1V9EHH6_9BACT|nr:sugar-binding domain-containing protein [Niastella yeongjuensis]OQP45573.1 beta-galactosidase [Niastella yeongjuensis]SEP46876.1 Glycosyl hydrolases family 2, TIM barrel domain [Niastella yeongjuensis]